MIRAKDGPKAAPSTKKLASARVAAAEKAARPAAVAKEKHTPVTVSLPPGLIKRLDDDAHEHRETRSRAARRLLEAGLK